MFSTKNDLSVLSPTAREPNGMIYLAYLGAAVLGAGLLVLGVGLRREPVRSSRQEVCGA
jgi:hypothetical protein